VTEFWDAIERDFWLWFSGVFVFSSIFNDIPFYSNMLTTLMELFGLADEAYFESQKKFIYELSMQSEETI
jgi:hypothetical protein